MLNLDTHIILHSLRGELTAREQSLWAGERCGISAIVFWEIAKLASRGRINTDLNDPELVEVLETLHVWPIDLRVCRRLSELDFSSDPVDEIIAATSLTHGVPLLTRDGVIRRSKVVPLAR